MQPNNATKAKQKKILVWDLPTRIFHWCFVIGFIVAWITSENDRFLYEHVFFGYVFFGFLMFRLLWGWVGSHYAKFHTFAYDWPSVTAYLKGLLNGEAERHIGHNPAGGWAIFAMLFLALFVTTTGFLVLGGEEGHGILAGVVSYEIGSGAKEFHEFFAVSLLVLVFVHVSGVIAESILHRENLVRAMISGYKPAADESIQVKIYMLVGVILLFIVVGSATVYFHGYITQTDAKPFLPFTQAPLPTNKTWEEECGECHLAFHPSLLPARSWQLMMEKQNEHFDEELDYDPDVYEEIRQFMIKNSADTGISEAAHKMKNSIPENETPLRITETKYWKNKHKEIDEKYWKSEKVKSKNNCGACHLDAKTGWFEDSNMRLPEL